MSFRELKDTILKDLNEKERKEFEEERAKWQQVKDVYDRRMQDAQLAFDAQEREARYQLAKGDSFIYVYRPVHLIEELEDIIHDLPGIQIVATLNMRLDDDKNKTYQSYAQKFDDMDYLWASKNLIGVSHSGHIVKLLVPATQKDAFLGATVKYILSQKSPTVNSFDPLTFYLTYDASLRKAGQNYNKDVKANALYQEMASIEQNLKPGFYERTIQPIFDALNGDGGDESGAINKMAVLLSLPAAAGVLLLLLFNR